MKKLLSIVLVICCLRTAAQDVIVSSPEPEVFREILKLEDGNFLLSMKANNPISNGNTLVKVNPDFEAIWGVNYTGYPRDIMEADDGHIYFRDTLSLINAFGLFK